MSRLFTEERIQWLTEQMPPAELDMIDHVQVPAGIVRDMLYTLDILWAEVRQHHQARKGQ